MHRIKPDALFIVDGSYLLYRSFFGLRPLTTSTGIPTQATYGFVRAIKKIIDDLNPGHLVVVWDSKGKSFRNEIYTEYKATRQAPPSDLFTQKEYILKFLDAAGIKHLAQVGYEADDIIAAAAEKFGDRQVIIVTADKDMAQLLADNVLLFDPFKNQVIDEEAFKKEKGFDSSQTAFFYSLLGDASDNIPGVKGIGEKTAQGLVNQFKDLDDLYSNLHKVEKERIRTLLSEQKDQAYLSMKLFLFKYPELVIALNDLELNKSNMANALPVFKELEFRSLIKEYEQNSVSAVQPQSLGAGQEAQSSFFDAPAASAQPEPKKQEWTWVTVEDDATYDHMLEKMKAAKTFGFDTETTGGFPMLDSIVGMSFACDNSTAYYIPLAHQEGKQINKTNALSKLKPILEDPSITVIMHNAKFDQLVMWKTGILMPPIKFDTLLAANMVRNEWQKINLKELSLFFLQEPMTKFKDVLGKKYKSFDQVPIVDGAEYGAHDALQTFKLKPILEKELDKQPTLKKIFHDIEMPFYFVLTRMEHKGIILHVDKIKEVGLVVAKEIEKLEDKIFAAIDGKYTKDTFNLNSPKQIERLLFDDLQLTPVKKSAKGSRSTDQEVLEELSKVHPIPGLIIKHRELSKLKNTYLDPLPGFVSPETGRVHTNYSQTMVATGRLSSSDPNLQNIPASGELAMQIREAFIAPEGHVFMSADYSQVELRILAHLAQDPTLIDIFKHNKDIHTQTAAQLFDVSLDKVTNEQRQLGKRINFSIIYGMSPFGLAKDLDIKQSDAKLYIEKYFAQYPKVAEWMHKTVHTAMETGYVQTWFGRRRWVPELKEKNRVIFENGKRIACNTPVQGTQAEIMKVAMVAIDRELQKRGLQARMILQIHDEMVLEIPENEVETVQNLVKTEMERVVSWEVPLNVSIRTGKNWADITK